MLLKLGILLMCPVLVDTLFALINVNSVVKRPMCTALIVETRGKIFAACVLPVVNAEKNWWFPLTARDIDE